MGKPRRSVIGGFINGGLELSHDQLRQTICDSISIKFIQLLVNEFYLVYFHSIQMHLTENKSYFLV